MKDPFNYTEGFIEAYERKYKRPFLYNPGAGWCRGCNEPIRRLYGFNSTSVNFHPACLKEYHRRWVELQDIAYVCR